jgi:uncharacterized membrane protein affecting hemolysin expression
MLNRFLQLPFARKAALIIACICFFNGILLMVASHLGTAQIINQNSLSLGNNLSQQLARDASNLLVQGDKLRLQSLLNNVVASPEIIRATIYDVENRPIAEAGDSNSNDTEQSYSASITFQDSLAGYAVIVIQPKLQQLSASTMLWKMLLINCLLAGLSYLIGLVPARYITNALRDLTVICSKPFHLRPRHLKLNYRGEDEIQQLAQQIIKGPNVEAGSHSSSGDHAVMHVDITNLQLLREQHTPHEIATFISYHYQQLATISKLYDGELMITGSHSFSVIFARSNQDDYPFRAICAAYLMAQKIAQQQDTLGIQISVAHSQSQLEKSNDVALDNQLWRQYSIERAKQLLQPFDADDISGSVVIDNSSYYHSSVENRIVLRPDEPGYFIIEDLEEPYKALLVRQLTTLTQKII